MLSYRLITLEQFQIEKKSLKTNSTGIIVIIIKIINFFKQWFLQIL